ncbi:hypothetical protein, partial [Plasmodium yoelii yoelii]
MHEIPIENRKYNVIYKRHFMHLTFL